MKEREFGIAFHQGTVLWRLCWAVIATLEFGVTIIVGVVLWLFAAIFWAAAGYVRAVKNCGRRAASLWVQRVAKGRRATWPEVLANGAPKSETQTPRVDERGPAGRGRFEPWMN